MSFRSLKNGRCAEETQSVSKGRFGSAEPEWCASIRAALVAAAICVVTALPSWADGIRRGKAENISGDADVRTDGNAVLAARRRASMVGAIWLDGKMSEVDGLSRLLVSGHAVPVAEVTDAFMETEWNYEDPIDEIYAIRAKISAKYGHDVHRIFEAVAKQQRIEEAKGRKYVRLPIARTAPAMA